jgi:multidrug efflux pump subunit AcrA (membrane-fusion protein)
VTASRRMVAIVVAALAIAASVGWWLLARRESPQTGSAGPGIPLAIVREGYVERTVALSGRVGPAAGTQTKLSFSVPGTVRSVDVRLGQHVDSGTLLAQIDATTYSLAAQQAGADAQAAAAGAAVAAVDRVSVKLRVDQSELQRQQRLYEAGVVALRDVQAAQAAVAADRAESQGARSQLLAAQAQARSASAHAASATYELSRTALRAPVAGVVTGIFVQPGDAVDSTIAAVALTPEFGHVATLDVPVNDVANIAAGDMVRARANGRRFSARVAGVAPAVNPATGLAVIDIRGVPEGLPAGTPVDATVVVGRVRGLLVPHGAVVEDPQNGNTLVFVQTRAADGTERFVSRIVTIDAQNDTNVRVIAGLRAGERVAAQGAIDLLAPSGGGD